MNRNELRILARIRLRDAKLLLEGRRYDAAYYLAGYVVECALKACIARQTRRFDFPPRSVQEIYTHDLIRLVKQARLQENLQQEIGSNAQFYDNWAVVQLWSESSRYERKSSIEAASLYQAIADPQHGVLRWLEQWW